uniref:ubiquitinyl hydrolase 1 n=1 Tax=Panagrellus redivivus TaxID=6233 RepID=A0A7E4UU62_PANRE
MGNLDETEVVVDIDQNGDPLWPHAPSSSASSSSSALAQRPMGPAYTFILPDLYQFPDGFRQFLERDMIEMPTLRRLEQSGHLNWWCVNQSQKLYPLVTTGDGNCLLHAASLGTWGVHDRQLHLRKLLYSVLKHGSRRHAFWRRWRWSESKMNLQSELVLSEEEWAKEWSDVLQMAAPTPRSSQVSEAGGDGPKFHNSNEQIYESLETIHVFALAHILKRPIIIVSDTVLRNANGEELSPIPFGGIYLPLECPPEQCHRSPLVLCYDSSHFSALVAMRSSTNTPYLPAIPIMDKNRNILPIHFAIDPSPDFTWWKDAEDHRIAEEIESRMTEDHCLELIGRYMDICKMDLRRGSIKKMQPLYAGDSLTVPTKLMTLASSGNTGEMEDKALGSGRILREIRQHLRRLGRKSKKEKHAVYRFSASELRQSNCILTALLHNFAHQYTDHMVDNYISVAKQRFDELRTLSTSFTPKNRMSRSFSSSSVLLTCLNSHCGKTASPSTNFLCPVCFEDQKREMASIGSSSTNPSTSTHSRESTPRARGLYADFCDAQNELRTPISTTNATSPTGASVQRKSKTMPSIATSLKGAPPPPPPIPQTTHRHHGGITIASTDVYFDSEPPEFVDDDEDDDDDDDDLSSARAAPPLPIKKLSAPRKPNGIISVGSKPVASARKLPTAPISLNRTNIHVTPGTAHCHLRDGATSNITTTKVPYHYATTKS